MHCTGASLVDEGASPEEAAEKVKQKFLGEICAPEKETYFYVGTVFRTVSGGFAGVGAPRDARNKPHFRGSKAN